jgi:hypothetical protein
MSDNLAPYTVENLNYEVTNMSSRTFMFGDLTLLPKIPQIINDVQKHTIENSKYGEFFVFVQQEPDPPPP